MFPDRWDLEQFPPNLIIRSLMLIMEKLIEDEETQVGHMDHEGFAFSRMLSLSKVSILGVVCLSVLCYSVEICCEWLCLFHVGPWICNFRVPG